MSASSNGQNDWECPICYYPFNDGETCPIGLKCGHSVCQGCVKELWKAKDLRNRITCPVCRKKILFRNVDNLPKNFLALHFMESRNHRQNAIDRCALNSQHDAWFACETCSSDFCEDCFKKYHVGNKIDHLRSPNKVPSSAAPKCSKHPTKTTDFMCTSANCTYENKQVCDLCLAGEHKGHRFKHFKNVVFEHSTLLKHCLIKPLVSELSFEEVLESYTEGSEPYQKQIKEIDECYARMIRKTHEEFKVFAQAKYDDISSHKNDYDVVKNCKKKLEEKEDVIRSRLKERIFHDAPKLHREHEICRKELEDRKRKLPPIHPISSFNVKFPRLEFKIMKKPMGIVQPETSAQNQDTSLPSSSSNIPQN